MVTTFRRVLLAALACACAPTGAQVMAGALAGSMVPYFLEQSSSADSPFALVTDSSRLDTDALIRMAARLGATKTEARMDTQCWEKRIPIAGLAYEYCFHARWRRAGTDTLAVLPQPWGADSLAIRRGRLFGYYSFHTSVQDQYRVARNFATFLHSAYHQETMRGYAVRDSLFQAPPPQTQTGLWSRGAISMGWAAHYAGERNPFMGYRGLLTVLLGIIDAGFGIAAVAVAADADSPAEALRNLAIVKAGHTAFSWAIFTPVLSVEIGPTIRVREAGYRFPIGIRMD